jgi:hypothetical protein
MNKIIPGLIAVLVIIAFIAFRNKPTDLITFRYAPPGGAFPYLSTKVSNVANWQLSYTDSCDGESEIPCTIDIDRSHTVSDLGLQIDPSEVTITTLMFDYFVYYVSGGMNVVNINNKSRP